MSKRVFGAIIVIAAVIMFTIAIAPMFSSVESFRTDTVEQSYGVTTSGNVTTDVALTHPLWRDSVTYVTRLSSNITGDSLIADNYTSASQALSLSGLAASATRTLTVEYQTAGLNEYTGADEVSVALPAIVVGLFLILVLAIVVGIWI